MINSLQDNPLFNICFPVGFIFIAAGLLLFYFPPKNINSLYGYRTSSSMKNQERWDFAQNFSAKGMMKLGAFLVLISSLSMITHFNNSINLIAAITLTLVGVVVLFIRVEKAIKRKFNTK